MWYVVCDLMISYMNVDVDVDLVASSIMNQLL